MLNKGLAGTGTAPLSATIRESYDGWQRGNVGQYRAGAAGRWADEVGADMVRGDDVARIVIDDMIRVCTGEPGTGRAMMQHRLRRDSASELSIGPGLRAVAGESRGEKTVTFWVADRCRVRIRSQSEGVEIQTLAELASALDMDALQQVCSRRNK